MGKKLSAKSDHNSTLAQDSTEVTATDVILSGDNKRGLDTYLLNPSDVTATIEEAQEVLITNYSIAMAATEYTHALQSGLKSLLIRNRTLGAETRIAFVVSGTTTNYVTLRPGAVYDIPNIDFTGKTLYLRSDAVSTVEIVELYT